MIILGILIWSQWPLNAPWILGLWVGFGLLINGITTLIFGTAVLTAGANRVTHAADATQARQEGPTVHAVHETHETNHYDRQRGDL